MINNIVAAGYVEDLYCFVMHGIQLGEDNYHVAVEVAFLENAYLLIQNEDIGAILVGHIIGSFIA